MKKLSARIAACSLAVLIAFNTVAIPKSRAVVVESALSSAIIGTYLTATGFAFTGKDIAVGTPADMYIAERLDIFLRDWSEAMDKTDEEIRDVIVSGFEFVGDGVVKVGSAAAGLLASFTDWLVDKFSLIGEDGEPVTESVGFVPSVGDMCLYNGVELPNIDSVWDKESFPYAYIATGSSTQVVFSTFPFHYGGHKGSYKPGELGFFLEAGVDATYRVHGLKGDAWASVGDSSYYVEGKNTSTGYGWFASSWSILWCNIDMLAEDDSIYLSAIAPVVEEDWENPILAVTLPADYEVAPTVDEQYAMVIDTGMTIEDEQEFVDAVLGGMLAGTLAPTYTIENTAGGDVTVPDEETDTQAGILSTVKNIAQSVISLPQTIAEAIKGLFVPDAALTQEITDTFSAKFDFISDLHGLGTDLLNLDPSQTPPVIYIHLEDADSNYGFAYGGITKALDMAWYEPYKEDVDRIISGFLWLGFLWLCFMRASDIINGAGMVYAAGQPTVYTPDSLHDAPRLEAPRWRRRGR